MSAKIYAIETTNFCNAQCTWCPHSKMKRTFGLMSLDTVSKVIDHCNTVGQKYIALHHMGEPLLHPKIADIITMFNENNIGTEFSTNGALLIKRGKEVLESGLTRLRIAVDYNYPSQKYIENIQSFLRLSQKYNTEIRVHTIIGNDLSVFKNCNHDAVLEHKIYDNWAGEVSGESKLDSSNECYFTKYNYVVVLWDGRVVPCCMDYNGRYILGTVDKLHSIGHRLFYKKCKNCASMQFAEAGEWEK